MKWAPLVGVCLLSCSGASLRGATLSEMVHEPRAEAPSDASPSHCIDARGAPASVPAVRFSRSILANGAEAVIERRPGYDALVIENHFEEANAATFAYVSHDAKRPDVLHLVRLPSANAPGKLLLSTVYALTPTASGFRATSQRNALECELASSELHAQRPNANSGG